jgi:hypothetical protein
MLLQAKAHALIVRDHFIHTVGKQKATIKHGDSCLIGREVFTVEIDDCSVHNTPLLTSMIDVAA